MLYRYHRHLRQLQCVVLLRLLPQLLFHRSQLPFSLSPHLFLLLQFFSHLLVGLFHPVPVLLHDLALDFDGLVGPLDVAHPRLQLSDRLLGLIQRRIRCTLSQRCFGLKGYHTTGVLGCQFDLILEVSLGGLGLLQKGSGFTLKKLLMLLQLVGEFLLKGGDRPLLDGVQVFLPGFQVCFPLSECSILLFEHALNFHQFLHDVVVEFHGLLSFLSLETLVNCVHN